MRGSFIIVITLFCFTGLSGCPSAGNTDTNTDPGPIPDSRTFTVKGVSFEMQGVSSTGPAGFQRDSGSGNISVISRPYYVGKTEVTQELFQAVMGANPSGFRLFPEDGETQKRRPVEMTNWYMALAFCNKLSLLCGLEPVYHIPGLTTPWGSFSFDGIPLAKNNNWDAAEWDRAKNGFRLPTEMEWLWAAMGADWGGAAVRKTGWNKKFAGDNGGNSVADYAWAMRYSNSISHEVGRKLPNELGLFDMWGNVWEYCWDFAYSGEASYVIPGLPSGTLTDYRGLEIVPAKNNRVIEKGTSFNDGASGINTRAGTMWTWNAGGANCGFRLALNY